MASVVQDPEKTADPSYLGLSQGTDRMKADTRMGELFEGISKLGTGAIKAGYGFAVDQIQKDIQSKVDLVQNEAGVGGAVEAVSAGQSPTDILGEANIFGENNVKAGRGNPAGLARFGQSVAGLDEAYHQGRLSDSYYNARLLAIVKEAKNQYPGFKDEIDHIIQKTTGINPANALVRSLRNDMDAMERARTAAAGKDESFFNSHLHLMLPSTRASIVSGDRSPDTIYKAKMEVAGRLESQWGIEQANRELEHNVKVGKVSEDEVVKVASLTASDYMSQQLAHGNDAAGGGAGIAKWIQDRGDKPVGPKEAAEIRSQMNTWRLTATQGIDNILAQPQYAQLPEEKRKQIREAQIARINTIEEALIKGDAATLKRDSAFIEATQNRKMNEFLTGPNGEWWSQVGASTKLAGAAGGELFKSTFMTPEGMKARTQVILELNKANNINGKGSLGAQVDRMNAGGADFPEWKAPPAQKAVIDQAVHGLVNATTPEVAANHAKVMFGPNNIGFLEKYKDNGSRQTVFRSLTSPAVDLKMAEIGQTHPEVYQNYKEWVVSYGFKSLVGTKLNELQQRNQSQNSYFNYLYQDGQFVPVARPELANEIKRLQSYGLNPLKQAQTDVATLNENIKIISPILARDGQDPALLVGEVLKQSGWDPNAPRNPGLIQSLGNAIQGAFSKATGASNPESGTQSPKELDYRLDKPRKGPVRTDGSTSQVDTIDLEAGGLQDISANSEGIKKIILKVESDGNFNDVYGTKRNIPLTKMTLDEVMALQGQMRKAGSKSTAVGGFQFLNSTLTDLKKNLNLTGNEIFDENFQHKLADALLQRRGFGEYLKGNMTHKELVNNLAKEWAGLPNTTGKSHYEGDGLNHANITLRPVLDELKKLRAASAE